MDDLRDTKRSRNVWSLRYDVIIVQPSATACVHEVETARLRNFISGDHAQEVVTIHEVATTLQPIRIDAGHAEGFHTEAMDDLHNSIGSRSAWSLKHCAILVHPAATTCIHKVATSRKQKIITGGHPQSCEHHEVPGENEAGARHAHLVLAEIFLCSC